MLHFTGTFTHRVAHKTTKLYRYIKTYYISHRHSVGSLKEYSTVYEDVHTCCSLCVCVCRATNDLTKDGSEVDTDEENEEGDYTVFECPGLAPVSVSFIAAIIMYVRTSALWVEISTHKVNTKTWNLLIV